jgi:DNA-binding winged helix-turn-helix (wHTH) protein/TolB-like protein
MSAPSDRSTPVARTRLAFGPFVLDPLRAELLHGGTVVPLRRKAFDLLQVLALRPGEVLGKDELLAAVWPGVVVGDDSLAQCVHELRAALGEAGATLVHTVPRRGYRFDGEVHAEPAATDKGTAAAGGSRLVLPLAALLLAGVVVAGLLVWQRSRPAPESAAPPLSIVMLPLQVLEPGETPSWFADALTADLTSALGQISGAFVISRETAATYRGRATDPRRIATELGVRYVAQGAARLDGDRVRLSLTLVNGSSGAQVWSQAFEPERGALAVSVEDIARQVARSLNVQMMRADGRRAALLDASQVRADDLAMQGYAVYFRGLTRDNLLQARRLFDEAVERDVQSVRGWGGVAVTNGFLATYRWVSDREAAVARVAEARRRLQALDEHDAHTYFALMWEASLADDHEGLLLVATRMSERLPSYPHAHTFRSVALLNLGRFDECIAAAQVALRLGALDPTVAQRKSQIATCHFMRGDYRAASGVAREAQLLNAQMPMAPLVRAAALARSGHADEGRTLIAEHLRRHPDARAADVAKVLRSEQADFAAGRRRLIESLHELGMN